MKEDVVITVNPIFYKRYGDYTYVQGKRNKTLYRYKLVPWEVDVRNQFKKVSKYW